MEIISDNTILVAILSIFLTLLILVHFFLALRHDHVVSLQRPKATLEGLEEQIKARRITLQDLDEDLKKRREALSDVAGIGAEVDALTTKRDELLSEWNMMAAKREEVRSMRLETEEVWGEKQRVDGEFQEAKAQLDEVKAKRQKAEDLVEKIETLQRREEELRTLLASLEGAARELQNAKDEVKKLDDTARELTRDIAALEGRRDAFKGQLQEISSMLVAERAALAQIGGEVTDLRAQRASVHESIMTLETKKEDLAKQVLQLRQDKIELEHVTDRLREAQEKLENTSQAHNATQIQVDALERRLSEHREELSKIKGQITAAEEMLEAQRRKLHDTEETSVEFRLKEINTRPAVLEKLMSWPVWVPQRPFSQQEGEALERVSDRFEAVGLYYDPRLLRAFHTSLKINETTQMTVLSGISGTGKSQLPRQYAAGMGIGFLQVPVQPRWDSPQDLMGFFNYIESRFRPTDLARALWQLDPLNNEQAIEDRMMLVLLDEMNLARVEYYFSDFLSRLESRPSPDQVTDENLRKDAEIELEIPMPRGTPAKRVFPGYNLLFTGTMNEDESTQSLSDKVVDRANVIRFGAPQRIELTNAREGLTDPEALDIKQWIKWLQPGSSVEGEKEIRDWLEQMRELMAGFKKPFGHRLGRAILAYVANYPQLDGVDRNREALADQVEMRLLPRLAGIELDRGEIVAQFDKLKRFVEYDLADSTLAEAIADSVEIARDGSGQFIWTGLTRE